MRNTDFLYDKIVSYLNVKLNGILSTVTLLLPNTKGALMKYICD